MDVIDFDTLDATIETERVGSPPMIRVDEVDPDRIDVSTFAVTTHAKTLSPTPRSDSAAP